MYKGYKVRLFPTPEQEELLWKHIGSCRFIWNYMIEYQEAIYKNGGKYSNAFDMCKYLTQLKNDNEHNWLYEVSASSLQIVCRDLHRAYQDFFHKLRGRPKFKSKRRSKPSYPLSQVIGKTYFKNGLFTIPSIGKVKYRTNYTVPEGRDKKLSNPQISYIGEKWILTFGLEFENQECKLNDFNIGIDLGIKRLVTAATTNNQKFIYPNINKSKKMKQLERKMKHIQRVIHRKYRVNGNYNKSNNIKKYEKQLSEIWQKMSNIRKDYMYYVINDLIKLFPKRITMETLAVSNMMKNKYMAKLIQEQCFYTFVSIIKYKCEWAGIEFVQASRWFPSSKTCSRCGEIKKDLKLSDRVYECPYCGLEIDRDYNAAINLMKYESQTERLSA